MSPSVPFNPQRRGERFRVGGAANGEQVGKADGDFARRSRRHRVHEHDPPRHLVVGQVRRDKALQGQLRQRCLVPHDNRGRDFIAQ